MSDQSEQQARLANRGDRIVVHQLTFCACCSTFLSPLVHMVTDGASAAC